MASTDRSLFTNYDFKEEELSCADSARIILSFSEWEYLGEMNGEGMCLAHAPYVATQLEMGEREREREDKAGREKTKICKWREGRSHTIGSLQRTISNSPR